MSDFPTLYQQCINAIVVVFNDQTGEYSTGFLVKYELNYYLVCNYHDLTPGSVIVKTIVRNVNNTYVTAVVLFNLIGYDKVADVAISIFRPEINDNFEFNNNQKVLSFDTDSRSNPIGTNVMILGAFNGYDLNSFNVVMIANNMYGGLNNNVAIPESLLLEGFTYSGTSGSPVINGDKKVIGMLNTKTESIEYAPTIAICSNVIVKVFNYFQNAFASFNGTYEEYVVIYLQHGFEVSYLGIYPINLGTNIFIQYPELELLLPELAPSNYKKFRNIGGVIIYDFIQAIDTVNNNFIDSTKQYIDGTKVIDIFNPLSSTQFYKNFYSQNLKYPVIILGVTYLDYYKSIASNKNVYTTISVGKFENQIPFGQFVYDSYWLEDPWDENTSKPAKYTFYYVYNINNEWKFNVETVIPTQTNPISGLPIQYLNSYTNTYDTLWSFAMPLPVWNYQKPFSYYGFEPYVVNPSNNNIDPTHEPIMNYENSLEPKLQNGKSVVKW